MSITENIKKIRTAVLGKDVRTAIADSIEECYKDATTKDNANMEVSKARGNYNTLDDRLNSQDLMLSDKATAEALAVERARIDNLLKLQDGSTTGDAELADIRVKVDGTVSNTAGTAVREQITATNSKLKELSELTESKNLFNTYFEDGSINSSSGMPTPNTNIKYARTKEFIEIDYVGDLAFQYIKDVDCPILSTFIFAYNTNKEFISILSKKNILTNNSNVYCNIAVNSDIRYLKIVFRISDDKVDTDYVSYINSMKFQLENGITATEYQPYMRDLKANKRIDNLNNKLSSIVDITNNTKNFFNSLFEKGAINLTTGTKITSNNYIRTDLISTNNNSNVTLSVYFKTQIINSITIAEYDIDKNFISILSTSSVSSDSKAVVTVQTSDNTNYILLCCYVNKAITQDEAITIMNESQIQLEYSDKATDYEKCKMFIKKENVESLLELENDIKVLSMNSNTDIDPLKVIKETPGYTRMFKTIGCIGDSVTKGYVTSSSGGVDLVDYSYPTYLERICGNKVYNWGVSGATSKSWLEGYKGSTAHIECFDGNHKCDAYIIGLGGNDGSKNNNVPVGSLEDIKADYNDNPNTFYGNMDKIIRKIKEIQPKAKIFLTTYLIYKLSRIPPYEEATRILATKYENCYLLDLHLYGEKHCDDFDYSDTHHKNALGYLKKAHMIATYIDWVVRNNKADFMNVQFIGTDYEIK